MSAISCFYELGLDKVMRELREGVLDVSPISGHEDTYWAVESGWAIDHAVEKAYNWNSEVGYCRYDTFVVKAEVLNAKYRYVNLDANRDMVSTGGPAIIGNYAAIIDQRGKRIRVIRPEETDWLPMKDNDW